MQNKAELWINPDILTEEQNQALDSLAVNYIALSHFADVNREPDVIKALHYVEKQTLDKHILVEYI